MSNPTNDMDIHEIDTSSEKTIQGKSVFIVETTAAGIAIQTALMTENGQLLQMPAIFNDIEYAFAQVDELRHLIAQHFSKAAQVGAKIIAEQTVHNQLDKEPTSENQKTH